MKRSICAHARLLLVKTSRRIQNKCSLIAVLGGKDLAILEEPSRLTRKSLPPSLVDTRPAVHRRRRGETVKKEPCLFILCLTYGVGSDSDKGTIGEECGLWTRVFHAKGSWSHSSFVVPETETPFRASLIGFFTALLVPTPTLPFLSLPQEVEPRLPFTPLDNQTPERPTTKVPCPQWSIPTVGWFLSFITIGVMQV
ncbi:hypothetical protein AVEN_103003-1 [Araneus ventricosus]|uniref:Uncharacterized protein n=1 Tax=Araneus ventricosus TaxID=182803 RepID=A0A4Y2B987_ARAVE|nr:hypothetical protein AVEN_103003-1 [Araneus ventricosus]